VKHQAARWGAVITAFYAAMLLLFAVPAWQALAGMHPDGGSWLADGHWLPWMWIAMMICGEALLLGLSVDLSVRMLRPRRHVALTAALAASFTALLMLAGVCAFAAGLYGDDASESVFVPASDAGVNPVAVVLLAWIALWALWGALFHLHLRRSAAPLSAILSWLIKGSVLELLIAVPAHVIAHQRKDCSAPGVTAFGIVTGLAVLLLCFGPGVLSLYRKRIGDLQSKPRGNT
jgi:hypothetical protein